jgi:HD-GYP domain-containing protein (c-di-GMP phosphodiesterase class II)
VSIEKQRKVDVVEKVKLRVGDLRKGMYVCELDRPWLETPFMLQGIEIKTDKDVELLCKYCEYVYIDLARTKVVRIDIGTSPVRSFINDTRLVATAREMEQATVARDQTTDLVKSFIQEIHFGNSVDIQLAKASVSECVASVMRNPDAMMFLTQLRSKDEYESEHAFNACIYSIVIGRLAGMRTYELENLATCALLHDVGAIKIPDAILQKSGKLTPEEFEVVKQHPAWGRDILMSGRNLFTGTVDVAYGHHEAIDGSGYPRGLKGHQINLGSKIVAIADKYDAIISSRPYRLAHDHLHATAVLNKQAANNLLDATLVRDFVNYLGIYPPGCLVRLSTGEAVIVLESNPNARLKPQVLVVRDAANRPVEQFVDLAELTNDKQSQPCRIVSVHHTGEFGVDLGDYKDAILRSLR